jgi:hypothetical protein
MTGIHYTEEERINKTKQTIEKSKKAPRRGCNQVAKSGFLDNKDTKEFFGIITTKAFERLHTPQAFDSLENVTKELQNYFALCNLYNQPPMVTSMCAYLGVSRDTIGMHMNSANSIFCDAIKAAYEIIHSYAQGTLMANKLNPMAYVFLAGNYWGMKDVRQLNVSPVQEDNGELSLQSKVGILNALREEDLKTTKEFENDLKVIEAENYIVENN